MLKKEKIARILKKSGYADERELFVLGYSKIKTKTKIKTKKKMSGFLFFISIISFFIFGWIIITLPKISIDNPHRRIVSFNKDKLYIISASMKGKPRYLIKSYSISNVIFSGSFEYNYIQVNPKNDPKSIFKSNFKFDFYRSVFGSEASADFFRKEIIPIAEYHEEDEEKSSNKTLENYFNFFD